MDNQKNLIIKYETLDTPYKIKAEKYYIDKFKNDGFECIKTISYNNQNITNKSLLEFLEKNGKIGIPDLAVFNEKEFFFVEVKNSYDTLRKSQIEWINNHPHIKVVLFYLKQKINSTLSQDALSQREKILFDIIKKTDIRSIKTEFRIILDVLQEVSPISRYELLDKINEVYGCKIITYRQLYDNIQLLIGHGAVKSDYITKKVSIEPKYISTPIRFFSRTNYSLYIFAGSAIFLITSLATNTMTDISTTGFLISILYILAAYYDTK